MVLQWVGVFLSLLSPSAPRPTFFLCNGELPSYEDCDVGAIVVGSGRSCFAMRVLCRNLSGGEDQCLGAQAEVKILVQTASCRLVSCDSEKETLLGRKLLHRNRASGTKCACEYD